MKRVLLLCASLFVLAVLVPAASALADPSPTGSPGQPGAFNGTTCQIYPATPGKSVSAPGSVFNPNGTAGTVYAGNPGSASLNHSNSAHAVSEYDIACFQQSQH
jgi:hypothetical protein